MKLTAHDFAVLFDSLKATSFPWSQYNGDPIVRLKFTIEERRAALTKVEDQMKAQTFVIAIEPESKT